MGRPPRMRSQAGEPPACALDVPDWMSRTHMTQTTAGNPRGRWHAGPRIGPAAFLQGSGWPHRGRVPVVRARGTAVRPCELASPPVR